MRASLSTRGSGQLTLKQQRATPARQRDLAPLLSRGWVFVREQGSPPAGDARASSLLPQMPLASTSSSAAARMLAARREMLQERQAIKHALDKGHDRLEALEEEKDSQLGPGRLGRNVQLGSFREAWAAMSELALLAEKWNVSVSVVSPFQAERIDPDKRWRQHHPDWRNSFGSLDVQLTSHDAGNRVTLIDIRLANALDEIIKKHSA